MRLAIVIGLVGGMLYGQGKINKTETGNLDHSGVAYVFPTAHFASPPASPIEGNTYTFLDAASTGQCTGTGSSLAICRSVGGVWTAVASTGGSVNSVTGGNLTMGLLGDSITDFCKPGSDGNLSYVSHCYYTWANAFLKQGFTVVANAGVSGNQVTGVSGMAARVGTDVIAFNPSWCMFMGGTNDIFNGVSAATLITGIKSVYTQLNAAGIKVVMMTILPDGRYSTDAAKQTVWVTVNGWMKEYAKQNPNLILVDTAAAIIDPTNANLVMAAGTNSDGTHPDMAGFYILGRAIANAINTIFVPPATLTEWNSDVSNYVTNAMQSGTSGSKTGGATGNVSTGWTIDNTNSTTCVGSKGTRTDNLPGAVQTITMTGAGATAYCSFTFLTSGIAQGDDIYAQAEIMSGSNIQHHILLVMDWFTGGNHFLTSWGGEPNQGTSDPVNQTSTPYMVLRTDHRVVFAPSVITVGIWVYGTTGTVNVGRVELKKVITP